MKAIKFKAKKGKEEVKTSKEVLGGSYIQARVSYTSVPIYHLTCSS